MAAIISSPPSGRYIPKPRRGSVSALQSTADSALARYCVVMIGGFLHACLSELYPAFFHDPQVHMQSHGITLERVPLAEDDAIKIFRPSPHQHHYSGT